MSPTTSRRMTAKRPHHQRWFQPWKVFSIMKVQLVRWQLLSNPISITLCQVKEHCRDSKGETCNGILACGRNVWFTSACSEVCHIYCFIADFDGYSGGPHSVGHNVIAVVIGSLTGNNTMHAFSFHIREDGFFTFLWMGKLWDTYIV